ncbi:hypothetical protein KC366_g69 [Hortaea werneckii]|nr:hypothetical protein KC366_g69 [Hortaea werneckii]
MHRDVGDDEFELISCHEATWALLIHDGNLPGMLPMSKCEERFAGVDELDMAVGAIRQCDTLGGYHNSLQAPSFERTDA